MNIDTKGAGPTEWLAAPPIRAALALLWEARRSAESLGEDVWEFALEADQLRAAGLTNTDLRQLLHLGFAEHARELTRPAAARRAFLRLKALVLPERTCFVLAAGVPDVVAPPPSPAPEVAAPYWDGERRQLRWRGLIVKSFRLPAGNQETVLAALQEECWPPRIDDPLPRVHEQDQRTRLRNTIKALNRNQHHPVIRFRGDGNGEGILWDVLEPA